MQRDFWRDTERIRKPIIDEHEVEEFDLRIIYGIQPFGIADDMG
jgi:hypothetical protein